MNKFEYQSIQLIKEYSNSLHSSFILKNNNYSTKICDIINNYFKCISKEFSTKYKNKNIKTDVDVFVIVGFIIQQDLCVVKSLANSTNYFFNCKSLIEGELL
ncbi:hypothetical protein RCIP0023_00309 [Klebsiella phage RCIP0023]|nr:hypothetical protein CPT_Muenster_083 [Klebsiella phage Muenster]